MKALDKLHDISRTLKLHNIDSPDKEAELILRSVLDMGLADIYRDNPGLSSDQLFSIEQIISRRASHEPIQYIIGNVDFMGLRLLVGKGVLIPRPETELIAEHAVRILETRAADHSSQTPPDLSLLHILDICTGSGCLALALAKKFPNSKVFGTDISETALSYAKKNAQLNDIKNVTLMSGDLFQPFTSSLNQISCFFDLIISNPPYIKTDDFKTLQQEIRDWEPVNALDGGVDGLDYYRAIIPTARHFLKDNGILILEIGIDCADAVADLLRKNGFSQVELIRDLAGIQRIAVGISA